MLVTTVEIALVLAGLYLAVGLAAAASIHLAGLKSIDPAVAAGSTWGFRLLITPGLVALWPIMITRWRAAAAGQPVRGEADAPVAAVGLRRRHRLAATVLLVVVPVLAAVGIAARPEAPVANPAARGLLPEPQPLARVVAAWQQPFASLPIAAAVRSDATGALQLELEVAADLGVPAVIAYWSVGPLGGSPHDAVFLGAVWGPGTRRLALPLQAADGGIVTLYSLGWRRPVAEMSLETAADRAPGGGR